MDPQPAERRREKQRKDAKRSILDATQSLLAEDGYEKFSIRRLAERCGYTAPTIYHYFRDKKGLIDALLEERFGGLLVQLDNATARPDPLDTLRDFINAYIRFGLGNPTFYRLMMEPRPEPSELASTEALRERSWAPIRELIDAGRCRYSDFDLTRQVLWAMVHGAISLQTSRIDEEWCENLSDAAVDTVLEGLFAPAGEKWE